VRRTVWLRGWRLGVFALVFVFVAAATGGGCKHTPATPSVSVADAPPPDAGATREVIRIQQISVEAAAWPENAGAPLEDRILAGRIWEGLAQSADFEAVGRRPPPDAAGVVRRRRARLRTIYGVEEVPAAGKTPGVLRATATLTVEWADDLDGPELWSAVGCDGEAPKDKTHLPGVASALVECALERAAQDLIVKEQIRHADLAAVLKVLDASDAEVRAVAFAAIGDRHLAGALPRLVELLRSPDELVRDGAIGALVALRDRRAVKPLTTLAEFKDLDLMRRIIDAVGTIGGEEAHDYLALVASGHEVPIIRELAQDALGRMDRRGDAGL
jgi:hypothetical protein